jgi:AraC-like DNA-binding protein
MECALIDTSQSDGTRRVRWSDLTAAPGFSDQAHLCREFRRHIGIRPGDFVRGLAHGAARTSDTVAYTSRTGQGRAGALSPYLHGQASMI